MKKNHFVDVIYTHTEGEPLCIIYSGINYPYDSTIVEKMQHVKENYNWLCKSLVQEPRGHRGMYLVFLAPPSEPDTDAGIFFVDSNLEYMHMCGHGTIALAMAMVAHGLKISYDSLTTIRLETTAGLVTADVYSEKDEVLSSQFTNVPAFVQEQDVSFELPGYGPVNADIVFGGNYFGIVKIDKAKLSVCPENGSKFAELGRLAKKILREKVTVRHPEKDFIDHLDIVTFYHEGENPGSLYRNVHVFGDGQLDRSPGGTGTSAMMAMLEVRGGIKIGQKINSEGLLGSGTFQGCLLGETKIGNVRAVIPQVKGTANIVGYAKWLIDPKDPVGEGFLLK